MLDFGDIALTGVFKTPDVEIPFAPMNLGRCRECGLVQLLHTYDQNLLYGETYGYESHLNSSMVQHLKSKAKSLESRFRKGEDTNQQTFTVVDIASNDGTLLTGFSDSAIKVGIDPLIEVVDDYYPQGAIKIAEFFSSEAYFASMSDLADLVTSLSVIYDLDDPIGFAKNVGAILKDGGIWHLEQSYLPLMCTTLSYDTVCHEHLLYLSLFDIKGIVERAGFQILEVSLNDVNGGSIAVTAVKTQDPIVADPFVEFLLQEEATNGFRDGSAIQTFAERAAVHKSSLAELILRYHDLGFEIYALGASTKGNVLLQWAKLNSKQILAVGDINPKKYGKRTPGTDIPILAERELIEKAGPNTIFLVLPWHFRSGIIKNCRPILEAGGKFLFPLPGIEVVAS